jgi:uncharacterized damage-inducible protein DinB
MVYDTPPMPGFPEPYGLLCSILQDATRDWRAELYGDLGPEVTTWRPRAGGSSIGGILLHMIGVEVFWFEHFVLGKRDSEDIPVLMSDKIDVDQGVWPDVPAQPMSWYFDLHDRYRARTLESIKQWPAADTLLDREGEPNRYTPRWVLGHVIQHETYHGGQIVMLHDFWKHQAALEPNRGLV